MNENDFSSWNTRDKTYVFWLQLPNASVKPYYSRDLLETNAEYDISSNLNSSNENTQPQVVSGSVDAKRVQVL